MGYYWGVIGEEVKTTSDDSVNGTVVKGMAYIL